MITTTILTRRNSNKAPSRRPLNVVLGEENKGASKQGSTFYKSLLRCSREHALQYEVGLRPVGASEPLDVGILVHTCLEAYYRTIWQAQSTYSTTGNMFVDTPNNQDFLFGAARDGEKAAFDKLLPFADEPGYEETYPVVERVIGSYFDFYRLKDKWRIVAVEETLEYEEKHFAYSARLDLIVEDFERTGLWIVETKTARALTSELLEGYQMDLQILGQVWLMKNCVALEEYPPLKGVIINILTKHKTPQFDRPEVCPSLDHLRMFERSVVDMMKLRQFYKTQRWPQALGNCTGISRGYTRCPYFDVCHSKPNMTVEDWNDALVEPPHGFTFSEHEDKGNP